MWCHGFRQGRVRAALLCVCLLAVACGDDHLALGKDLANVASAEQVLPELGCFGEVNTPGRCGRNLDCPDGQRCIFDVAASWTDRAPVPLTCGSAVGAVAARAVCKLGSDCESGLCSLSGTCIEPCKSRADCGDENHCRPVEARVGDALGPVKACVRPLVLPDDVEFTVSPQVSDLRRGVSTIAVPGASHPAIVYVQSGCARGFDVLRLRSLDMARELYDRDALAAGARAQNTVLHDGSSLLALVFPNNPQLAPSRLGLTLEVQAGASEHAEVVVASRKRGLGVLDLNLFYAGGGSDMVEGGFRPGEHRIAVLLRKLDLRLQRIGLGLGQVHEHEVVGVAREELSVLDVPKRKVGDLLIEGRPARLDELFRLSAGVGTLGINVFLIREMGDYIGIAGGIPGVVGLHGSERSGLALAVDMLGDLDGAEVVLMHEIGHFLGLFHTSESSGAVLDPLTDTPECGSEQDLDHDHSLSAFECMGHGGDNLMFWTGAGATLTPQQISVMADSVLFR